MEQAQIGTVRVSNVINEVVRKVAEAEDVDPLTLTPPLYEAIDPDALDRIFARTPTTGRMEGQVTFSYSGYEVTVCSDGSVSVQ